LTAFQNGSANGIGYVISADSDILAVDLDSCVDPQTGKIESWAQAEIDAAPGAYKEITVGGYGLRILGIGSGEEIGKRWSVPNSINGAAVETYRKRNRYVTISAAQIAGTDQLTNIDAVLDDITKRYDAKKEDPKPKADAHYTQHDHIDADIDALIRNGAPQGFRSKLFARVVWTLANRGKSRDDIFEILSAHPLGIGEKYTKRLGLEIDRCYKKVESQTTAKRYHSSKGNSARCRS
jgi:hypothetical protein